MSALRTTLAFVYSLLILAALHVQNRGDLFINPFFAGIIRGTTKLLDDLCQLLKLFM